MRRLIFWPMLLLIAWGYVANDINEWVDECIVAYSIISILCVWALGAGLAWWAIEGKASTVFRWLMVLVFGLGLTHVIQIYSRNLLIHGNTYYATFMDSWIWNYRVSFTIISLVYLLAVIVSRMLEKDGDR